jgi:hypothetical protein
VIGRHHRRAGLVIVDGGVALRGDDRFVAEQRLHGAQVAGAGHQHRSRAAAPTIVRASDIVTPFGPPLSECATIIPATSFALTPALR